ncbi:MAG: DMT family transporter [Pseudomonadota bacterium]|nr:DMT family transporter [Pseudomonadota bacterium]
MTDNTRAAVLIMVAMTVVCINDAIIKHLTALISLGQLLALRGLFVVAVLVLLIRYSGRRVFDGRLLQRANLLRSVCDTLAVVCYVAGLSFLALPVAATLAWTSPIILTLLALVVLRERVDGLRWLAVSLGFAGIVLVVQPWGADWNWKVVLPFLTAVLGASRDLITRYVDHRLHALQLTLVSMVLLSLVGAGMATFDWQPLAWSHAAWLLLSALCLALAYPCMIVAIRIGELSFIAPFHFTGILVAVALGYLLWNDFPNDLMWCGISCIVIAGIVIYRRGNASQPAAGRTTS